MPTSEQLITLIENKGVGFVLIILLAYALIRGGLWLGTVVNDFYTLFKLAVTNHAAHIQQAVETIVTNTTEANKKLDAQNALIGSQSQKLDRISERILEQTAQTAQTVEKVAEVVAEVKKV